MFLGRYWNLTRWCSISGSYDFSYGDPKQKSGLHSDDLKFVFIDHLHELSYGVFSAIGFEDGAEIKNLHLHIEAHVDISKYGDGEQVQISIFDNVGADVKFSNVVLTGWIVVDGFDKQKLKRSIFIGGMMSGVTFTNVFTCVGIQRPNGPFSPNPSLVLSGQTITDVGDSCSEPAYVSYSFNVLNEATAVSEVKQVKTVFGIASGQLRYSYIEGPLKYYMQLIRDTQGLGRVILDADGNITQPGADAAGVQAVYTGRESAVVVRNRRIKRAVGLGCIDVLGVEGSCGDASRGYLGRFIYHTSAPPAGFVSYGDTLHVLCPPEAQATLTPPCSAAGASASGPNYASSAVAVCPAGTVRELGHCYLQPFTPLDCVSYGYAYAVLGPDGLRRYCALGPVQGLAFASASAPAPAGDLLQVCTTVQINGICNTDCQQPGVNQNGVCQHICSDGSFRPQGSQECSDSIPEGALVVFGAKDECTADRHGGICLGAEGTCVNSMYAVKPGGRLCVDTCNDHLFLDDTLTGNDDDHVQCVRPCPSSANYVSKENYCIASCASLYFQKNTGNEKFCIAADECKYRLGSGSPQECVDVCPSGKPIVLNGACGTACNIDFPYKDTLGDANFLCVASCPAVRKYMMNGQCEISCHGAKQFAKNDVCVESCGTGTLIYADPITIFETGGIMFECKAACPAGSYIIPMNWLPLQLTCAPNCITYNVSYEYYMETAAGMRCLTTCTEDQKFYEADKKCVGQCGSKFYKSGVQPFQCVPEADCFYYITIGTQKECYDSCPSSHKAMWQRECFTACPGDKPLGTAVGGGFYTCSAECYAPAEYQSGNSCTTTCVSGAFTTVNGRKKCVTVCSSLFVQHEFLKECFEACPRSQPYLDNGVCLSQCPTAKSFYYPNGTCTAACTEAPYLFQQNGACVSVCNENMYEVDGTANVCVQECPSAKKYNTPGDAGMKKCVVSCQSVDAYLLDPNGFQCVAYCAQELHKLAQPGQKDLQICGPCPDTHPVVTRNLYCLPKCWYNNGTICEDIYGEYCPFLQPQVDGTYICRKKCAPFKLQDKKRICLEVCPDSALLNRQTGECLEDCVFYDLVEISGVVTRICHGETCDAPFTAFQEVESPIGKERCARCPIAAATCQPDCSQVEGKLDSWINANKALHVNPCLECPAEQFISQDGTRCQAHCDYYKAVLQIGQRSALWCTDVCDGFISLYDQQTCTKSCSFSRLVGPRKEAFCSDCPSGYVPLSTDGQMMCTASCPSTWTISTGICVAKGTLCTELSQVQSKTTWCGKRVLTLQTTDGTRVQQVELDDAVKADALGASALIQHRNGSLSVMGPFRSQLFDALPPLLDVKKTYAKPTRLAFNKSVKNMHLGTGPTTFTATWAHLQTETGFVTNWFEESFASILKPGETVRQIASAPASTYAGTGYQIMLTSTRLFYRGRCPAQVCNLGEDRPTNYWLEYKPAMQRDVALLDRIQAGIDFILYSFKSGTQIAEGINTMRRFCSTITHGSFLLPGTGAFIQETAAVYWGKKNEITYCGRGLGQIEYDSEPQQRVKTVFSIAPPPGLQFLGDQTVRHASGGMGQFYLQTDNALWLLGTCQKHGDNILCLDNTGNKLSYTASPALLQVIAWPLNVIDHEEVQLSYYSNELVLETTNSTNSSEYQNSQDSTDIKVPGKHLTSIIIICSALVGFMGVIGAIWFGIVLKQNRIRASNQGDASAYKWVKSLPKPLQKAQHTLTTVSKTQLVNSTPKVPAETKASQPSARAAAPKLKAAMEKPQPIKTQPETAKKTGTQGAKKTVQTPAKLKTKPADAVKDVFGIKSQPKKETGAANAPKVKARTVKAVSETPK